MPDVDVVAERNQHQSYQQVHQDKSSVKPIKARSPSFSPYTDSSTVASSLLSDTTGSKLPEDHKPFESVWNPSATSPSLSTNPRSTPLSPSREVAPLKLSPSDEVSLNSPQTKAQGSPSPPSRDVFLKEEKSTDVTQGVKNKLSKPAAPRTKVNTLTETGDANGDDCKEKTNKSASFEITPPSKVGTRVLPGTMEVPQRTSLAQFSEGSKSINFDAEEFFYLIDANGVELGNGKIHFPISWIQNKSGLPPKPVDKPDDATVTGEGETQDDLQPFLFQSGREILVMRPYMSKRQQPLGPPGEKGSRVKPINFSMEDPDQDDVMSKTSTTIASNLTTPEPASNRIESDKYIRSLEVIVEDGVAPLGGNWVYRGTPRTSVPSRQEILNDPMNNVQRIHMEAIGELKVRKKGSSKAFTVFS